MPYLYALLTGSGYLLYVITKKKKAVAYSTDGNSLTGTDYTIFQ